MIAPDVNNIQIMDPSLSIHSEEIMVELSLFESMKYAAAVIDNIIVIISESLEFNVPPNSPCEESNPTQPPAMDGNASSTATTSAWTFRPGDSLIAAATEIRIAAARADIVAGAMEPGDRS